VIAEIGSRWWEASGAVIVALAALRAYLRERSELNRENSDRLWPTFWLLTALLLGAMAVGHVGDLGGRIADLGRRQARTEGWYSDRRTLQVPLVGLITATWIALSATAIVRFPERRRRYLPTALTIFTLICFVAIRMISLHHVDSLLHRTHVVGIEFGLIVEVLLLIAVVVLIERALRQSGDARRPDERVTSSASPRSP
jgi:hypothetical protein